MHLPWPDILAFLTQSYIRLTPDSVPFHQLGPFYNFVDTVPSAWEAVSTRFHPPLPGKLLVQGCIPFPYMLLSPLKFSCSS